MLLIKIRFEGRANDIGQQIWRTRKKEKRIGDDTKAFGLSNRNDGIVVNFDKGDYEELVLG